MPPMKALRAVLALVTVAAGACAGKPSPKLEATATWTMVPSPAGCDRRVLRIDVATYAFAPVATRGAVARADENGKAVLEVRQGTIGRVADHVRISIEGGERDVPLPPLGAARPVAVTGSAEPPAGTVVWRGTRVGPEVPGQGKKLEAGVGVIDGQDLVFRLVGCDLRGGSVADGSVGSRDHDELEVRIALARRLAASTSLAPLADSIEVAVENADGARGTLHLDGELDVAAALAAMQAAAGGVRVDGAPVWQPGKQNPILAVGPGLTAVDVARATKLLQGAPIGRTAAALVLVPAPAADRVDAKLVARATGATVAERSFPATASAPVPWADVLGWLEDVQRARR